jgi:hypothetical protein
VPLAGGYGARKGPINEFFLDDYRHDYQNHNPLMSTTADCNAKVKEYSMKVFVPLGYSINENELEVIFPDVSFGVKMKIKNSKLIGHNYILSSENGYSFLIN